MQVESGSWMMAGRRTYLEPVLSAVRSRGVEIPLSYYFYDFNGKVNQRWGDDTFTVSTYWGQDDLRVDIEDENESFADLRWGIGLFGSASVDSVGFVVLPRP